MSSLNDNDLIDFDLFNNFDFDAIDNYLNPVVNSSSNESLVDFNNINTNYYYNNANNNSTQWPNNTLNRVNFYDVQTVSNNISISNNNNNNNNNLTNNNNNTNDYSSYQQNGLFGLNALSGAQHNFYQNYANNNTIDYGFNYNQNSSLTHDVLISETLDGQLMSSQEFIQQNCSQLQTQQIQEKVNETTNTLTAIVDGLNDKTLQILNSNENFESISNENSDEQREENRNNNEKEKIAIKGLLKLSKCDKQKTVARVRALDRNVIESRIRIKRERNRIAAKKCREKKLEVIRSLENRKNWLIEETTKLENDLVKRRSEIIETKMFILRHRMNGCKLK